jgi:hypothetical protein
VNLEFFAILSWFLTIFQSLWDRVVFYIQADLGLSWNVIRREQVLANYARITLANVVSVVKGATLFIKVREECQWLLRIVVHKILTWFQNAQNFWKNFFIIVKSAPDKLLTQMWGNF